MFSHKHSERRFRGVVILLGSSLLVIAALMNSFSVSGQTTTIPLGTYIATIAEMREGNSLFMIDEVKVSFLEGGKFISGSNDWIIATGNYTVVGDRVEFSLPFGADSCAAKGVYQWSVTGNKLTLALAPGQTDDCQKRAYLQRAQTYFKVDPAESHWKTIGPMGGNIQSLLVHDGKIFAGTWDPYINGQFGLASGGGVFVSEDNGQSWKSTKGMRGYAVAAMAAFNGALYAATSGSHGGPIFISLDGGQTWEFCSNNNTPASSVSVFRFAIGNGKLYAIAPGQGVMRLTDNPYVWEKLGTTGLPNLTLNAIAAVGANLFVSTGGSGIYVSQDGNNWTPTANNGLPTLAISTLLASGNALYAGTSLSSSSSIPNEVFVTTDNGQNWTRVGNGLAASLPGQLNQVFQLAVSGGKLFAASSNGILVNEGGNWRIAQQLAVNPFMFCLAVKDDLVVAGSSYEGVVRSLDGGATWSLANNGLNARTTYAVLKANNVLYTGGYSGVFISTNEGQSWTNKGLAGIVIRNFLAFDNKVWAGTSNGVYVTANQGGNWIRMSNGLAAGNVTRIVAVNNVLYAAVSVGGVFRSDNGGQSWTAVNTGLTNLNVLDLVARGNYLFASIANNQVMRSVEGQSWAAVNNGLPASFAFSLSLSGNTLLAAMWGQGIYRSTDNGDTWTKSEIGLSPPGIFTLYASGGNVYASGDFNVGALRSTDGGQSWSPINLGFDPRYAYGFFADGATLYAATIFGVCHSASLVNQQATVSAASYSAGAITEKAIVAAFGTDMAMNTEIAGSVPLPTTLAGTTIKVRDSNGVDRLAPMFFVSPFQINYQIPAGTAPGSATVTIRNSAGIEAIGSLEIKSAAPSIFTTNASGTGAAAAVDAITGTAAPFNAKRADDQPNIIAVFGTGLGGDATDVDGDVKSDVTARIDGKLITIWYAGRAPGYIGLNQVNIELPANITSGTHTLTLTRGVISNTVTIAIR
ncbi:MAG TPA: hypothetical protein PLK30_14965 [Blastocatellia bacterium]|nr:hypothetical protein [Blastocatellia bacterium]